MSERGKIVGLREGGATLVEITISVGRGGIVTNRPRSGRPTLTNAEQVQAIVAREHPITRGGVTTIQQAVSNFCTIFLQGNLEYF